MDKFKLQTFAQMAIKKEFNLISWNNQGKST